MAYTVLVVEDDITINDVVCEYLQEAGFIVLSVITGESADGYIEQGAEISLFILDIMLPDVSGIGLLKKIRSSEQYRNTPVIILTALDDEYTQIICFDGLADDYITKPFSPKILIKRVEALLRRSSDMNQTMQFGKITIDVEAYEAYENGIRIPLTLKELELLKVLLQSNGRVLSRQQLLNYAWGYSYFGDERIIDVHIKNLRKKFKSNIITTVKGVGYKVELPRDE